MRKSIEERASGSLGYICRIFTATKRAKDLWKYLLIYNRITASWENCIAYYEAFEMIDDILCSYIDNNIEQIWY